MPEHVQLIEKVDLEDGVWMTLWSLEEETRLSMEIVNPSRSYTVGDVFLLDREGQYEASALSTDFDQRDVAKLAMPIPVAGRPTVITRWVRRRASATTASGTPRTTSNGAPGIVGSEFSRDSDNKGSPVTISV